jgi:hypothetical protein
MHITYHAGERFLQRVFQYTAYKKRQVLNAIQLLKRDFENVDTRNKKYVVVPTFPDFYGVFKQNTLVTVIPKR